MNKVEQGSLNGASGDAKKKNKVRGQYRQELTDEQKAEIKEAFDLFTGNGKGELELKDLKVALRALGFEPAKTEIKRLINDLNQTNKNKDGEKGNEGEVLLSYEDFLNIMTTKMSERDGEKELEKAFILFSQDKDHITFEDLKRISIELGEHMTDDELKEMLYEANKSDRDGVVDISQFLQILQPPQGI